MTRPPSLSVWALERDQCLDAMIGRGVWSVQIAFLPPLPVTIRPRLGCEASMAEAHHYNFALTFVHVDSACQKRSRVFARITDEAGEVMEFRPASKIELTRLSNRV
ncbi:hypothetical protein vBCbaSRXM_41 [Citromicrobium phage vB_CbaS-RXM]|nr:hypothetical protein vBCbaSRXM_41 [Citromicrobium phage vB_CbaS-RXM]